MEEKEYCCHGHTSIQKAKPYIAMICLQFGYAGMNIITKASLSRGMSHYVLVVYRHAFATAVLAPFAIILERQVRPKLTFTIFMQIFILALLGPVIDQNLYYAGLKFTSPTFSSAMSNILPAMTFVLSLIFRMEKLEIKKMRCQAKVVGSIVTVCGAGLMTLYKGHIINLFWSDHNQNTTAAAAADKDWVQGSVLLIFSSLAWASFCILQGIIIRKYSAQLSLIALVSFMGTLQSMAATFVMEQKSSVWMISWDINLLAAAYAGIVSTGIAYYVQGLVMEKKGTGFVTAFSPLTMIIVAIMGSFILAEKIFLGSVVGAVLIVIGLYTVIWVNYKEDREKEAEIIILEPVKNIEEHNQRSMMMLMMMMEDIEMQRGIDGKEASFGPAALVNAPTSQVPMIALQAPIPKLVEHDNKIKEYSIFKM